MPTMKAYEREHLKLLEGILTQLTRIANAMEGDALEPEEVYSKETLEMAKAFEMPFNAPWDLTEEQLEVFKKTYSK